MKIFILVGLQLSGKSSHGHRLREEEKVPMVETGHAVYHELKRQNLEVNHKNTTQVILSLLSRDPTAFTQTILDYEEDIYENSSILILNGVKSPAEINYTRKRFGKENVTVLGFHAGQKTRYNRVTNPDRFTVSGNFLEKTQEDQDLAKWDNFLSRDVREIGLGIGNALATANEIIITEDNNWPFYSFEISYNHFRNYIMNGVKS
ncbi:MAG: hypothetical protein GOP50_09500 [Candidatus Heimdallarchaeota archaeon]|nr:hypothetical protein [Candidatus Heimdallarchaeota archaeon]